MEKAKKTFEAQWHEALNEAEVAPPPHIWVGIDNELSEDRVAAYKKEADFYKWVAAACLLLFAIGTAIFWSSNSAPDTPDVAREQNLKGDRMGTSGQSTEELATLTLPEKEEEDIDERSESLGLAQISTSEKLDEDTPTATANNTNTLSPLPEAEFRSDVPHLNAITPLSTEMASTVQPWTSDQLYAVARTWETLPDEFTASPLWAGVSFSSGSFDPGFDQGGDFASMPESLDALYAEATVPRTMGQGDASFTPGQSVGGGFNVGKRVSRRFMLSSGIQYRAFSTGSVSSQLVSDELNNTYALTNKSSDEQLQTALNEGALTFEGRQVQLANEYQYLSIPLKAGYVLLDKKFNITLNTGIAGNFRMNSKLVADDASDVLSNDFNTNDRYQNVYFNLLTSMEFGYLFKKHYQFLLEPNYNQALTDFTSSSNPNRARPTNVGITIGFRYNF